MDTLLQLARPGPRYTSYPTVPRWSTSFPDDALAQALSEVKAPASVYVHVPFCAEQCSYCGCNMVVAGRQSAGDRYLDALERQIEGLPLPAGALPVSRVHLGGGTPTWLSPEQLERLYGLLRGRFAVEPGAEISVEVDPGGATPETIDVLVDQGVNRLSFGIQSFDPVVLAAVNRPQSYEQVLALMQRARQRGVGSVNLDLMFGLPEQSLQRFSRTLERALDLAPERLAVFGYAHVPWLKPHQRKLDDATLPSPRDRVMLQLLSRSFLRAAGYQAIGLDHYALPEDELAVAQAERRLHRNFMGYTTQPELELIGLGVSAISELGGLYAQARPKLASWYKAIAGEERLVERGWVLSPEDKLRREVIHALMCNLHLDLEALGARWGIDARQHLGTGLQALETLQSRGMVLYDGRFIEITEEGRPLVRQIAGAFDPSQRGPSGEGPRFSQAV
ncbi:MAG: oxygen-independent coproporphyrinogen III oxidase [Alphaproteobacteria bacterium]|nr:oxygen-independent coproporphyrinogen III oxidase [Alphaproteobacteria bacterium]